MQSNGINQTDGDETGAVTGLENIVEQLEARVYRRQIDLLYENQTLAVLSTTAVLSLLMFFLNLALPWSVLLPWSMAFATVLSLRLMATWYYTRKQRRGTPVDSKLAEKLYFTGVVLTGASWGGMLLDLFPQLEFEPRTFLLLAIQGFVSVSHNTMGYRRLPYLCYTLLIALPALYVVYQAHYTYQNALVLLLIVHLTYVLHTANTFYQNFTTMLHLQEESVSREHRLLLQREQASLANQAKSEFLSRMSHELRTPLNAVLGLNELQMLDHQQPLAPRQKERAEKIAEAGRHLLSLVNDVLDLSRIEAGSLAIKLEAVDVQKVIRDAMKLVETRASERSVSMSFESLTEAVWVMADAQRLKQVIVNLLDNAIKYNRLGGTVTVTLNRRDNNGCRISIVDTGYGIVHDDQYQLFQPFVQLKTVKTGTDGAGIGLSFSKQLVELMKGRIGFDSRAGEGSCFWVEFPITEPQIIAGPDDDTSLAQDRHIDRNGRALRRGRKLLLVEDNIINQEVALEMLQEQGFDIDIADNGAKALAMLKQNSYALVLMDCEMPVMDGMTATRKLRQYETDNGLAPTPVIALTAHAVHGAREKCLASGMDGFLSKPFSYQDLHKHLSKWLKMPAQTSQKSRHTKNAITDATAECHSQQVIDMAALDGLRNRKTSLAAKVIKLYLQQSAQVLDDIDTAIAAGDYDQLSHTVHTFKSSSLTVGAVAVAEICRQIEADCAQSAIEAEVGKQIRSSYKQAEQVLQQLLDEESMTA